MIIDCNDCEMYQTDACSDCLVKAVLSHDEGPLVFEPAEQEAIENLQEAGLAPVLRFRRKAG